MQSRSLVLALVVLAAVAAVAGKKLLIPEAATTPAAISATPAQSFLVILGVNGNAAINWDGSITAT